MRKSCSLILLLVMSISLVFAKKTKSVLIFSKTTGFRHKSIPKGVSVVSKLLKDNQIQFQHTEDAKYFHVDSLKKFDGIIFLNTTGDILDETQKKNFQKFIQSGKGYVGIHAASDTEHNWPWYGALVGGYFNSHPAVQDATINVINRTHPSTSHLQKTWIHRDEWYDFKDVKPGLNILMNLDETSYKGGKMGKFHPIAWFQEFDGGRSFYTGLGHTDESYDSESFQKHIIGGVKYALNLK
ncbi:ThuA domain-containing protein [Sphingobacterium bovistauri]|uniref:ThuA domain-containing protein n=1 Tax=Sphingobacterium bovistauri TaxID=2781959 RepID=A0ABS7Z416_9SPHI|nr:ThuA domain-containing protein [Sphingobacterium bovistauri]MCA5004920.1 ThuA domain-containing protein [Sphingobacterium bovistauri]